MKKIITLLTFLILGLTLTQCQEQRSQKLPFGIVDAGPALRTVHGDKVYLEIPPTFLVITQTENIEVPWTTAPLRTEVVEKLRTVNYQEGFAIIMFRGYWEGTSAFYTVEPVRIVRQHDTITLEVDLQTPPANTLRMHGDSSPYKIVQVRKKGGDWGRTLHFVLEGNGQIVQEHTYFVP